MVRRDYLTLGLRLVLLLPVIPILVLVIAMEARNDEVRLGPWIMIAILCVLSLAQLAMHAFISLRDDAVRIGFLPLTWRTIPYREIAAVEPIKVDAMRDFGGWGVKGKSREPRGMLFSAGGHHALMIMTLDGRRYIVTHREPLDDVHAILQERVG